MNTMLSKIVFVICVLLLGESLRASEKLAVTILPESSFEAPDGTYLIPATNYYRNFNVVLSNKSPDPVRVWEDWNSWGYYNLTFDIKLSNGNVYHLKKKQAEWTRNFPSYYIITPDSYYIMIVNFNKDWEGFPDELKKKDAWVFLKATYTIPSDKDAEKYKIWTGTVESGWQRVFINGFGPGEFPPIPDSMK